MTEGSRKDSIYVSVVIPAYNEETRLAESLGRVLGFLEAQPYTYEVIIVDDGSQDRTVEVAHRISGGRPQVRILRNGRNLGKGGAVRSGMLQAEGQYVFFTDADLSVPIETISPFLARLEEGFDVAIGTRARPGAIVEVHQPIYRELMGKVYTSLSNWILGLHISDFTCGWKGFCREVVVDVFSRQLLTNWAFDSEILFLAKLRKYQVIEIPVRWRNDQETKVRLWRDVITSFLGLFQIRLYAFQRRYQQVER
jgi:dolichyl-phosphate beta-glucosyltransferase